jgi:hypothetical protein
MADIKSQILDIVSNNQLLNGPIRSKLPAVAVASILLYGFIKTIRIGHRDKRLPPGPPTLPILGNLHQIPITGMYKKYSDILG